MKRHTGLIKNCILTVSGLAAPLSSVAAQDQAPDIDRNWVMVRQDLEIFIAPEEGEFVVEGSMVVRLEREETSGGPVILINRGARLMEFDDISSPGASIEMGVQHPKYPHMNGGRLTFATPKQRGEQVTIHFAYHCIAMGNQLVIDKSAALGSWVEAWYPLAAAPDSLSLGGATKVAGTSTFHLPVGWHAVTNGALVSSEQLEDETVEVWRTDAALSRSFAAGPYKVIKEKVDELDISLYLLSKDLPSPRDNVTSLALAMQAMEKHWGPYPYPSYAIAEVPSHMGHFGASSEQGFIMVKPSFLRLPGGNLPLFAHEAAHGWWGNTVGTKSPGALICSESLAQYGAVIAAEAVWGKDEAVEFLRFSWPGYIASQCAAGYFEIARSGQDIPMVDLQSGGAYDHTLSDAKGHWVFHMLRRRVGDELFFRTMRALIKEFTDGRMSLDDLRARYVAAAPEAGLEPFFEQWLERTGTPVLIHDWEETAEGIRVTILQLQEGEAYDLWVDVSLEGPDGTSKVERVHVTEMEASFLIRKPGNVSEVHLNADHGLLLWEPAYGPSPVPELEDLQPRPLDSKLLETCAGTYTIEAAKLTVLVEPEGGQLMLELNGMRERLTHTGRTRFRSKHGFVQFDPEGSPCQFITLIPHSGVPRHVRRVP